MATDSAEVARHRAFDLPVIEYPNGEKLETWGLPLALQVDPSGRVTCYLVEDGEFGNAVVLNARRRALLKQQLASWRYQPFIREGRPVTAVVRELIYEQRLPSVRREMPDVPLDKVSVSLRRGGCYGNCPVYQVEIRGDGVAEYRGEAYVDVQGNHQFRVPAEEVAALVASARDKNLWSMDPVYRARVTDSPTYVLNIRMGDSDRCIEDYVGAMVGMPEAITQFQHQVDRIGRTQSWTRLSNESVEGLQREGFDFHSKDAGALLLRAVANPQGTDDRAMARLVELGAPMTTVHSDANAAADEPAGSLLDLALRNHRAALVDAILARGALLSDGVPDQEKVDGAFRAAIRGGRLSLVQRIWDEAGPEHRPSLTFIDPSEDGATVIRKQAPVSLLLSRPYGDQGWEGLQIAQWLSSQGCDLNATNAVGGTLLHVAVQANDVEFVRYLLAHGADVSAKGHLGLPALGGAEVEDIALILLEAGSDWRMNDDGKGFLRYARYRRWGRVLAFVTEGGGK